MSAALAVSAACACVRASTPKHTHWRTLADLNDLTTLVVHAFDITNTCLHNYFCMCIYFTFCSPVYVLTSILYTYRYINDFFILTKWFSFCDNFEGFIVAMSTTRAECNEVNCFSQILHVCKSGACSSWMVRLKAFNNTVVVSISLKKILQEIAFSVDYDADLKDRKIINLFTLIYFIRYW